MSDLYITGVHPWGAELSDVEIRDGRIAAVHPAGGPAPTGVEVVEGDGRQLVPSFSDVHVHLDSTRLGLPWRPNDSPGGVWSNMLHDRAHWREGPVPMRERSTHMLGLLIAHGVTRVRGYAQIDADCKLERLEAVAAARETHAARADVEIIAFPQAGLLREPGVPGLVEAALREGATVMGGIDPCALDRDPVRHLDIVFGLAERYGVAVDVHLHEPGELGLFSLGLIIERTRALDLRGKVTISHAFTLAHTPPPQLDDVLAEMAELDISVATVAPPGRGTLPLTRLTEAGIRVGLGDDGQRDYWSPYGNADLLDRTWQLAFTNGFRNDPQVEHALAVATWGGASVIDPSVPALRGVDDRPGVAAGDPADLVLLDGEAPAAAVQDRLPHRTVIHAGRVVAHDLALV
ncbi:amidohydrolase family protein [Amycolatopsis thermophila]|uniref:Cytosine/adenosine deaminase-related metal-dependent hydrolase n=1 Tax=Amycolatopsis thermophila TaxID=206084 RepID=A0ABU0F4C1_9PSEU|nr:amidohydrolase family protein [Amycolatopsis thermophila]MDQ0382430.1 cytosine/adenosine deaminase-related metal-dependent hydrolase [Amycolatopsis thermophila]